MRYVMPTESVMFAPVTGTVDADYLADWLTDGRSTRPVQVDGAVDLDVTPASSLEVGIVALVNYRLTGTVDLLGSLSDTIALPTLPPDGIPKVAFTLIDPPVSVSTLTVQAASAAEPNVIGELYAGTLRNLGWPLILGQKRDPAQPFSWEGEASSQPPYDPGVSDQIRLVGDTWLSDTELAEVDAWYQSTKRGTRPTLIVPTEGVDEALLVVFKYSVEPMVVGDPQGSPADPLAGLHHVYFEFLELPRVRWS
jgi:hypothetical protein